MKAVHLIPWRPQAGDWDLAAAHHLLVRSGFGAAPGEAQELVDLGFADAKAQVLSRDQHDRRLQEGVHSILASGQIERLSAWWMALILGAGAPLRERVTLMWHNHFATSMAKVDDHRMMHAEVQLFRTLGMGDFRKLMHAVARDPAMLRWLDGDKNRAGSPNENFAREVMELFTLGIGNYSESDVKNAARAFTGWRASGRGFKLRKVDHDAGQKTLLGQSGPWSTREAVDILLASPHCLRHIARRLLMEFVHPNPKREWVEETAAVLERNDWHIGRTIAVLLNSKLFFSSVARRSRIAGPVELMVGAVRGLGIRAQPAQLVERCAQMGQKLFHPKSVKGWDGMRSWINAGTWIGRHNSLIELCNAHAEHVDNTPEQLLEQLIPELSQGPFARKLERALAQNPQLLKQNSEVAALILSSPEYHLV